MAANGGRMALISDEGGIFDTLGGQHSKLPNLDPYLMGHSGRPLRVDRLGREAEYIPNPTLTVGVMAQPSVLRKFGTNGDLTGRGIVARFLFVLPVSLAGYRDDDAPPVSEHIATVYATQVHALAASLADWTDPVVLTLTDDARTSRSTSARAIEVQLRRGGALYDMREWANKLTGTTMRLAALLHVAHHPDNAWQKPVDGAQMTDAVRLVAFFIEHYRAAMTAIAADTAATTARHALGVLIDKEMLTFSRRDLHRRMPRRVGNTATTAATVAAAIETLIQYGWVRQREDSAYELHPAAADISETADTLTIDLETPVSAGQTPIDAVSSATDRC
ncbi:YfjI family protein [Fodinicola feengrottensis]|uniref:YfjI family protein n=2 Tax=Fodinicola feengrottensis TaxID=435914 RepID=UPI0024433E38|nr:YfjI family protein [Fodinicola feengrottensis]